MISWMRSGLVALAFFAAAASFAEAAQLVMIDSAACSYCQRFKHEVAPTYAATRFGENAPLRLVSVLKRWPEDLKAVTPMRFTPVFILVEHGKEVGRMYGYKGKDDFWARLEVLFTYL